MHVAWAHFPLFIFNKATSLAAVVFVACAYLVKHEYILFKSFKIHISIF